ncbi:MAG TPA: secretin N-terminal domain-containing protein, partial [Planctomycetota bacterium]|nr:secretin N-terminal domain-containing protein [Planctomycetota bacterium]
IQEILKSAEIGAPAPAPATREGGRQDAPPAPPGQEAPKQPELPRGGKVQADDETNSLIVRGSKRDIAAIRLLAGRLDKFEPQALIQVLMAEVTLDHDLEYGVQWFWQNKHAVGGDPATSKITGSPGTVPANLAYQVVSNDFEFMLRAFAQDGRLKLLANPSIFVKDGKTGDISIGQRVPFVDSTRQTPEGGTLVTIRYEDVGIKLVVTPKINPDGLVTMDVLSEISEFSLANTVPLTSDVNAPTFSKNSAKTVLTIKSGQPVFLGGLIRETEEEVQSKIPILGDLPGIGALFSSTKKTKQRRELVMLIRPHVAWTQRELEELTQSEVGKLKLLTERDLNTQTRRWMDDFSK